jgi:hypothetical protein
VTNINYKCSPAMTSVELPRLTMRMPCYDPGGTRCSWLESQTYTRPLWSSRTSGRQGSDKPSKLYSPTLGLHRALHESSAQVELPRLSPEPLPRLWLEQLGRALCPTTYINAAMSSACSRSRRPRKGRAILAGCSHGGSLCMHGKRQHESGRSG